MTKRHKEQQTFFATNLLLWHQQHNHRQLPWKNESDPYKIWLSEIMLQQTRAEAVIPYYQKFLQHFPSLQDLAKAEEQLVFKLWEGLGYYNRCRNLITTAREIVSKYEGVFPQQYEQILSLKGIGKYTAAAIVSFAYEQDYAVLDGNVYRILARFFYIDIPIDTTIGKQYFERLAQDLMIPKKAKAYNQAIMDFGAMICTPKQTRCQDCVFHSRCKALQRNSVSILPTKTKKIQLLKRDMVYLVLRYENLYWIRQRTEQDIWKNLYEFFELKQTLHTLDKFIDENFPRASYQLNPQTITQKLTHQHLHINFVTVSLATMPQQLSKDFVAIQKKDFNNYAFPKALKQWINTL